MTGGPELYRVMALDYGTRRIGVAMSDELRMLASARGTVQNDPSAIKSILDTTQRENVRVVLLGLPTSLKGTDSEMTTEVRSFGEKLSAKLQELGVQFHFRDERLTSVMANYFVSQSGLPKHRREEKGRKDEEAARIVLQEYLDQLGRR